MNKFHNLWHRLLGAVVFPRQATLVILSLGIIAAFPIDQVLTRRTNL